LLEAGDDVEEGGFARAVSADKGSDLPVRDINGKIIIPFEYQELYPPSCGLMLARNFNYHYGYIDAKNNAVVPFGEYEWADSVFVKKTHFLAERYGYASSSYSGYARVMQNGKWGIINHSGEVVIDIKYDKIWVLNRKHLDAVHAEIDGRIEYINLCASKKQNYPTRNSWTSGNTHSPSAHDYSSYNDVLDPDQQDIEFWNNF